MDADFMATHVLLNEHARSFNNTGADNKKGCVDILFLQFLEESPRATF